jgi:hypothetical protein
MDETAAAVEIDNDNTVNQVAVSLKRVLPQRMVFKRVQLKRVLQR